MILKSIKWRLQLWYGLVLLAVLLGFGITAYQLERGRQFRRVDDELHRRANLLLQSLHHPPHGPPSAAGPEDMREARDFLRPHPPGRDERTQPFKLPPQFTALFDATDPAHYYYVIRGPDGQAIAHSTNAPAQAISRQVTFPPRGDESTGAAGDEARPGPDDAQRPEFKMDHGRFGGPHPIAQLYGQWRELTLLTPSAEAILVGCDVTPELAESHMAGVELVAFGALILFIGLAGGWVFVGRALRPISEISATAAKISAGDLSQRINTAETESELGRLAGVLNSTFARLETAFAQQKQFASDAAHELRTPVSVILTQTQTALARDRDAASYRQTVEACQRAAQRMRRLIESLLELARFDAGQEVMKRFDFDLAKTVSDCMELVHPLGVEHHLNLSSELDAVIITGDAERIAQVITNLLMNAIQFSHEAGAVNVRLTRSAGMAVLAISDSGKGIPPEELPRVFERFYRADKSRTGASNSGLGLSICKAIVEAHGGTIEAASTINMGSTFTVRLPSSP